MIEVFGISIVTILGAVVASMVLGMLWYGPLFGKQWMALMKLKMSDAKKMQLSPGQAISLGFVSTIVSAVVLACFVSYADIKTIDGAVKLAGLLWLGFSAPLLFSGFLWENKPIKLFILNATHRLIELVIMALILVRWG